VSKRAEADQERYSDEEVRQRAKALARAVLSLPPKPQKDVPRKRPESKRKSETAGGPPVVDGERRP
jgi:hypothetical protein